MVRDWCKTLLTSRHWNKKRWGKNNHSNGDVFSLALIGGNPVPDPQSEVQSNMLFCTRLHSPRKTLTGWHFVWHFYQYWRTSQKIAFVLQKNLSEERHLLCKVGCILLLPFFFVFLHIHTQSESIRRNRNKPIKVRRRLSSSFILT